MCTQEYYQFAAKPIRKAREYWMCELQTIFQYGYNVRIGDEFKLIIRLSLPRRHFCANH